MWSDALKCNKMWMLSNERSQAYHMSRYITLNLLYKVQQLNKLLYIELSTSFLIGWKHTVNFLNQHPWCHNCTLYNYHIKDTQGHRLSCQVHTICVVSRQWRSKIMTSIFFFVQCIIKQLLVRFGFCDILLKCANIQQFFQQ